MEQQQGPTIFFSLQLLLQLLLLLLLLLSLLLPLFSACKAPLLLASAVMSTLFFDPRGLRLLAAASSSILWLRLQLQLSVRFGTSPRSHATNGGNNGVKMIL